MRELSELRMLSELQSAASSNQHRHAADTNVRRVLMDRHSETPEVHSKLPKQFPGQLQNPAEGSFNFNSLQWSDKAIAQGPNKGKLEKEAYILTTRVDDFKTGRCDYVTFDLLHSRS